MLTITNLHKIANKTLGKKNFYVARIEEDFDTTQMTIERKYKFELSNRKYAVTVTLDREPAQYNALGVYFKLYSSSGYQYYISLDEISNIDIFIDKLRYVALG
jgi:hypothetical protein